MKELQLPDIDFSAVSEKVTIRIYHPQLCAQEAG